VERRAVRRPHQLDHAGAPAAAGHGGQRHHRPSAGYGVDLPQAAFALLNAHQRHAGPGGWARSVCHGARVCPTVRAHTLVDTGPGRHDQPAGAGRRRAGHLGHSAACALGVEDGLLLASTHAHQRHHTAGLQRLAHDSVPHFRRPRKRDGAGQPGQLGPVDQRLLCAVFHAGIRHAASRLLFDLVTGGLPRRFAQRDHRHAAIHGQHVAPAG
jgi:hypothetical protein